MTTYQTATYKQIVDDWTNLVLNASGIDVGVQSAVEESDVVEGVVMDAESWPSLQSSFDCMYWP